MKRNLSIKASWLAALLLVVQALFPLAHLAAHAMHHAACPSACSPAPDSELPRLVAAASHTPCFTCQMLARLLGSTGEWQPDAVLVQIASTLSFLSPSAARGTAFDFNAADARGPPAISPTAV